MTVLAFALGCLCGIAATLLGAQVGYRMARHEQPAQALADVGAAVRTAAQPAPQPAVVTAADEWADEQARDTAARIQAYARAQLRGLNDDATEAVHARSALGEE